MLFRTIFVDIFLFIPLCVIVTKEVIYLVKEEIWSIAIPHARNFFRSQPDVTEESMNCFVYKSCRIELTELKPKGMGIWAAKRIKVHMEGGDEDTAEIYHRFFIQFLSTGG